ncbi:unnamed protein product [Aureobasidium vineae]|uniref:Uncharacterized protein n=1 Tax=Aureobasidium vineae TaxID=2773715 RepID=A0A9N8JEZ8_9PEZI|nr:unnamed protein product [Aureobasidium vineae]
MQALWSRIAQTGLSCHCPSCVSAGASGVARRTTNAAGRRPVRWALSSTFVYSGIFAAAATTDAGFKQKRREQWDRAIADIKHDLDDSQLGKTTQARQETEGHLQAGQEQEGTYRWKPLFDDPQDAVLEDQHQEAHLDGPVWPENTGAGLHRPFVAPTSIYARTSTRERAFAARWTTKKIRTTELAVDKLILRMLLHLDELNSRKDLATAVPESCHDLFGAPTSHLKALLLFTNDQHMEATTFPDPNAHFNDLPRQHKHGVTYRQDGFGEYHKTAQDLNSALGLLFEKKESGQLAYEQLVARIAYNLYISSAAPNLDCWNTLLRGFMECDNIGLVNPTLYAIENANVRHNETTIKATLKYYIMINRSTEFTAFVDRIRGVGKGLMLAKPTITVNDSGRPRLVVKEDGKIVQKPYHTPAVTEVIVQGVLHFIGFDAALRIATDMGQEGWGLSIRGLTPLLDDRARKADYKVGCQIWDLIKRLQEESRAKGKPERLFARTYSAMMRLCSACNEMARFDEILCEARAAKYEHRELLNMFRQEMLKGSSPVRQLADPNSTMQRYRHGITQADFENIEEKEPEKVDEEVWTASETPAGISSPNLDPTSGLDLQDDDDWLDSPIEVRQ